MMNLHWALGQGLLEDEFDADVLVAAASSDGDDGSFHTRHCNDAPTGVRVSVEMPWSVVQALLDAGRFDCWCMSPDGWAVPAGVAVASRAGDLVDALELGEDWGRTLAALTYWFDVRGHVKPGQLSAPVAAATAAVEVAAVTKLADGRGSGLLLPYADGGLADHLAASRGAFARHVGNFPSADRLADPVAASRVWDGLVEESVWAYNPRLSSVTIALVTGVWVDPGGSGVLVRLHAGASGTVAAASIVSRDSGADPSTLVRMV